MKIIINMSPANWLSSADALALLGVRPQTLYANVSRRRIRTKPDPQDPRKSLYHAGDVHRLAARHRGRPSNEQVAAESVSWGNPILPSGVSTVAAGRLWYRGVDAVRMAEHGSLEDVAGLLWECGPIEIRAGSGDKVRRDATLDLLEAAYRLLAARACHSSSMYDLSISLLRAEAAELFGKLTAAMIAAIERNSSPRRRGCTGRRGRREIPVRPVHERLARAWDRPNAADAIRRALVLLADHELNASTFATRVAASTGAPLAACILAGLATLTGPRHGAAALSVHRLLEAAAREGAESALLDALRRGDSIPAFGHPLYPDGDVRACALLDELKLPPLFEEIRARTEELTGELPNVDFALAGLAASASLPPIAPFIIFVIARSVGWIAHALEQSQHSGLIRPRARYVGPPIMTT